MINVKNISGLIHDSSLVDFLARIKKECSLYEEISLFDKHPKHLLRWASNPINKNYDVNFDYKNDSFGFRNSEFLENPDVVCLGCSMTYGSGVPKEQSWPTLLSENLNLTLSNYGIGGASTSLISMMYFGITRFVNPKYIVIYLPDHSREFLSYRDESGEVINFHGFSNFEDLHYPKIKNNLCKSYYELTEEYFIKKFINEVQKICVHAELKSTKVFISSWSVWSYEILKKAEIDKFKNCHFLPSYIPTDRHGRDLIHPGIGYHIKFANLMSETILKSKN
jgi:hypothetical protein